MYYALKFRSNYSVGFHSVWFNATSADNLQKRFYDPNAQIEFFVEAVLPTETSIDRLENTIVRFDSNLWYPVD